MEKQMVTKLTIRKLKEVQLELKILKRKSFFIRWRYFLNLLLKEKKKVFLLSLSLVGVFSVMNLVLFVKYQQLNLFLVGVLLLSFGLSLYEWIHFFYQSLVLSTKGCLTSTINSLEEKLTELRQS